MRDLPKIIIVLALLAVIAMCGFSMVDRTLDAKERNETNERMKEFNHTANRTLDQVDQVIQRMPGSRLRKLRQKTERGL